MKVGLLGRGRGRGRGRSRGSGRSKEGMGELKLRNCQGRIWVVRIKGWGGIGSLKLGRMGRRMIWRSSK